MDIRELLVSPAILQDLPTLRLIASRVTHLIFRRQAIQITKQALSRMTASSVTRPLVGNLQTTITIRLLSL
jgi:hypothetical protein